MRFEKQGGTVRQAKLIKTTIQSVAGGEPEHTTLVEIPIEVKVDEKILAQPEFQRLFPWAHLAVKEIAGREGDDKRGLDQKARGQMPTMGLQVWDTKGVEGAAPAYDLRAAEVKGRAALAVDEDGNAVLSFKVRDWLTCEQLGRLGPYTNGDVFFTGTPVQGDITAQPANAAQVAHGTAAIQGKANKKKNKNQDPPPAVDDVPSQTHDDGKTFLLNPAAQALFKEAKKAGRVQDDQALIHSACQVARLAAAPKSKKITVTAEDLQEALTAHATPDPADATTH